MLFGFLVIQQVLPRYLVLFGLLQASPQTLNFTAAVGPTTPAVNGRLKHAKVVRIVTADRVWDSVSVTIPHLKLGPCMYTPPGRPLTSGLRTLVHQLLVAPFL